MILCQYEEKKIWDLTACKVEAKRVQESVTEGSENLWTFMYIVEKKELKVFAVQEN